MVFISCGICDREYGLSKMREINSCTERITGSGLSNKFQDMIAPLSETSASSAARAYANAVTKELVAGVRREATHICAECYRELGLPGSVPKLALVNGYFRGALPPELQGLSLVDLSLISIVNVVATIAMMEHGTHYKSSATVFSVLNNVVEIAAALPRSTRVGEAAIIIRMDKKGTPKSLKYNPFRVLQALHWLQTNNHLYSKVSIRNPSEQEADAALWEDGGRDQDCELPHISASVDDYEGIREEDQESPAGADGHAVNPGAPDSSTTDVFLHNPEAQDTRQQLAAIALPQAAPAVVMVRSNGGVVYDNETPYFLQKAFPHIFPYGRGGPGDAPHIKFGQSYISDMLHLGGSRAFQQCPRFIFYAYSWVMKHKVGLIALLADKNGSQSAGAEFTVREARELLTELSKTTDPYARTPMTASRIWSMISKLQPYAQCIPGTELYFRQERKKLLAMVSSAVTTSSGRWTWFFTEAQADKYLAQIYDNAVTSFPATRDKTVKMSRVERQAFSDALNEQERADILRAHPFMSARIHALQQEAFWSHVFCGKRQPLGEVLDYWMRVEFQMKGTPHWHTLININKDSMPGIDELSVKSDDPAERRLVEQLVERVATARLLTRASADHSELPDDATSAYRVEQEREWGFNLDRPSYFADVSAPARKRFKADGSGYGINSATGEILDPDIQVLYRRLQLANQMHRCRKSCYKYCRKNQFICRYDFPREPVDGNETRAVIVEDRDRRSRIRTRVLPPRNNANLNSHLKEPLCFIAGKGNQDIQYIQNTTGGAEYCSKYCSKAEAAETSSLQNAICRKLAWYAKDMSDTDSMPWRLQLRAVGNAVVGSQQVGTVEACYMLGKLPLVKSSRVTDFVNCSKRSQLKAQNIILDEQELGELQDEDSALSASPKTQTGKRDAYYELWKQQNATYGEVNVHFFAFLSSYTTEPVTEARPAENVTEGCKLLQLDANGFIIKPVTFKLGKVGKQFS